MVTLRWAAYLSSLCNSKGLLLLAGINNNSQVPALILSMICLHRHTNRPVSYIYVAVEVLPYPHE